MADSEHGDTGRREVVVLEHAASRAQQRLWFVEELTPGHPVNTISVEYPVHAGLDPAVVPAALGDLVARHEALRTVLRAGESGLRQIVLKRLDPFFAYDDVSGEPDPEAAYRRLRMHEGRTVFDLEHGPLMRVRAVRLGPQDCRMLLAVHHAAADGWSFDIMMRDLLTAYEARSRGAEPDLAPLPIQYADFTAWQESRRETPEAQADLAYWRERLADLPTLDLTRGRPRPQDLDPEGGTVVVNLPAAVQSRMRQIVAAEHATLFAGLAALWAEAVGRWFGSSDVPIGTPVAGRPLAEVEDVIGMFVDRVVLRVDRSGRPDFRGLLRRTLEAITDADAHSAVSFEQVVDVTQPERRLGLTPLFQVAVNLVPLRKIHAGQFGNGTVRHDLNLEMLPGHDGLEATVEYRHGVVSAEDAAGVSDLFSRLAAAAVADPGLPLERVPTLAEPMRAVRDGGPVEGTPSPIHEVIAETAARHPDAVAVVAPQGALTYAQLLARADALARRLAGLGVGPETPVLLAIPRRAELIVGLLAVLGAGGVYVPVDPGAPPAHLEFVASDLGARVALVAPGTTLPALPGVAVVEVDATTNPESRGTGEADGAFVAWPKTAVRPANAAYVLYTSGTTGTPKGVVVEHRQLVAHMRGVLRLLDVPEGSSFLMVQPPTFDSCATVVYGALLTGGTLHLVDEDTARDADALGAYCDRYPVDYLKIVPSHLSALLAGGDEIQITRLRPARALILGGEGSRREFVTELLERGWPMAGHYGPTETTVGVLAHWLTTETGAHSVTTPLGTPLAGVRAVVLDADNGLDPVPPGCVGELCFGGELVTRGYAGRPGRTAEVFVPDPFSPVPGARLYRTGDLARELPDGTYEILGRTDRQLKVNGHRIEPGAVEAVLERHPAVRQAVATAVGDRLIAYVVPVSADTAEAPDGVALRAFAAASLPGYSVPAAVAVVDAVPQKPNGKIDYAALPQVAVGLADTADAGPVASPATDAQAKLAELYGAVLGRDTVSVDAGFFALGGDSIRAIRLVSLARQAGFAIQLRDVFELQSVRELAAFLDERGHVSSEARDAFKALLAEVPPRPTPVGGAPEPHEPVLDAETVAALAGPAHSAYLTETAHLVCAAAALAAGRGPLIASVAIGTDPPFPAVVPFHEDLGTLIRGVKQAVREGSERAADWLTLRGDPEFAALAEPDVAVEVGPRIRVGGPFAATAAGDRLAEVVRHCLDADGARTVEDFPDSGLSADQLGALLGRLGEDA